MTSEQPPISRFFPDHALELLEGRGLDLIETLGLDAIREVVVDVLSGINLRNATETLTRRRIALLNAALTVTYVRARQADPEFPVGLTSRSRARHGARGVSEAERRVLRASLGLTKKQVQNVLRSDQSAWDHYVSEFSDDMVDVAADAAEAYGEAEGHLRVGSAGASLDWLWLLYLSTAIGSQTLATRGSEKSMYGKFFEKLVLGGVLHVMGLSLVKTDDVSAENVYWMSSRGERRESDATALFGRGRGIRFDIGFIGEGNTEVSLDKVSRYEREIEIGGTAHFMHTFIIVDRIGARSRIVGLAEEIDGTILQMSASYWPKTLGEKLEQVVPGFNSPLSGIPDSEIPAAIVSGIASAPLEQILKLELADQSADDE